MSEFVACIPTDKFSTLAQRYTSGKFINLTMKTYSSALSSQFSKLVRDNITFEERNEELENNTSKLQLIPYCLVRTVDKGKILYYIRSSETQEKRLNNKLSIGIGGHVSKDDIDKKEIDNVIYEGIRREIKEEIGQHAIDNSKFLYNVKELDNYSMIVKHCRGLIYDPSNTVGKVHLGLLFNVFVDTEYDINKTCKESEFSIHNVKNGWLNRNELRDYIHRENLQFETWSDLVFNKYLIF
jgi:predicted NUDIX family phosphoesterase